MFFQCINIRQVPWEVLKTEAFGLGFQHLPRDLANVNAWKTMFDPYINFIPEQQMSRSGRVARLKMIHFQGCQFCQICMASWEQILFF